jgi:hypothetical protein
VTFAKGCPLLTLFFPGMSEKMSFWQGMRDAGRGAGGDDQSGKIHSAKIFLLT